MTGFVPPSNGYQGSSARNTRYRKNRFSKKNKYSENNFSKKYKYGENNFSRKYQNSTGKGGFSKKYKHNESGSSKKCQSVRAISVRHASTVRVIPVVNNNYSDNYFSEKISVQ